jgi:SM-20-related protein
MTVYHSEPAPCSVHARVDSLCTQIADSLGEQGWCVTPQFLSPALVAQARDELEAHWQRGDFRPAGIGRGASLQLKPSVRTDWVRWLDPVHCEPAHQHYLAALEYLRAAINRSLYLGLVEFESHLAVYPPGTYYRKHLDQFRDMGTRSVSCILYLNDAWQAADGGQLRIYTDARNDAHYQEILPLGGQLVTFLSTRFLHEVMPATRHRMSITGWFKIRG